MAGVSKVAQNLNKNISENQTRRQRNPTQLHPDSAPIMVRDDPHLSAAKRAYRNASMEGNRQEEARWANLIGDIFKNRGEYVEALKWLRIDYDISMKYLPEKQLLPTCQSVGELLLRLENFKDALIYQVIWVSGLFGW